MDLVCTSLMCVVAVMLVMWSEDTEASHNKLRIIIPQRINLLHHHRKTVYYAEDYGYGKHHFSSSCRKLRRRRPPRHRRKGVAVRSDVVKNNVSDDVLPLRTLSFVPEPDTTPVSISGWDTLLTSPTRTSDPPAARINTPTRAVGLEWLPPLPPLSPDTVDTAVTDEDAEPDHDPGMVFGARQTSWHNKEPTTTTTSTSRYAEQTGGGARTRRRPLGQRQPSRGEVVQENPQQVDDLSPASTRSKTDDVYYQAFRAFSFRTSRTSTSAPDDTH